MIHRNLSVALCLATLAGACQTAGEPQPVPLAAWSPGASHSPRETVAAPAAPASASSALEPSASLEEIRARAMEANPGVRAAFERWQAALERRPQSGALPDPRLSYRYYLESVETRVGPQEQALGLSQTLPWPGRLALREGMANAEAEAARARYQARVAAVLRAVDSAWYDAYFLERAIAVVRRNRDLLALLEEVLQRRYSAGEAEYADLIRAQVELGKLDDRLRTLEDQRRPLAARLNASLDRPSDAAIAWPDTLVERRLDAGDARVLEWVRSSSPELVLRSSEIEREERAGELARLEARPDFTLGLEWIDTGPASAPGVDESGKDPWIASLSLNLPVWGGRVRAAEEEARARRRAASLAREETARQLESDVQQALYEVRDARRREELYRDALLPRARQAFEALEAAFRGGRAAFLDLVDAERTLLEFELALERARTDQAQAISHLERLAGRPLESLAEQPATVEGPR